MRPELLESRRETLLSSSITMANEVASSGITPYLVFLIFVTTLGPLQFGYHLVRSHYPDIFAPLDPWTPLTYLISRE